MRQSSWGKHIVRFQNITEFNTESVKEQVKLFIYVMSSNAEYLEILLPLLRDEIKITMSLILQRHVSASFQK